MIWHYDFWLMTSKMSLYPRRWTITRICLYVAIITDVFLQRESRQVEIRDDLYRVCRLPQVLKVFSSPTVWNKIPSSYVTTNTSSKTLVPHEIKLRVKSIFQMLGWHPRVKATLLTACNSQRALLSVQWVEFEIHRARKCKWDSVT